MKLDKTQTPKVPIKLEIRNSMALTEQCSHKTCPRQNAPRTGRSSNSAQLEFLPLLPTPKKNLCSLQLKQI